VYEESLDIENFHCVPILHCRDHEPFILTQVLAVEIVVKKIPCEIDNKEVYASFDWGIEYRTYVDTSLWDPCSIDASRVIHTMAHIQYRMVHDDTLVTSSMVCSGIQQHTSMCDGMPWVFGIFPLGKPPDREFKHIIDFGSPRIDECMDALHGEVYGLDIDLQVGYHHIREKDKDIHIITLRCYLESLVIPLGLTSAPNIFQFYR
jgi:hypothetical protein